MTTLHVVIPGVPHGQGRPRACVRGNHASVYERGEDKSWKAYAQDLMRRALLFTPAYLFEGPVSVQILAVWPCPKSARKVEKLQQRWRVGKPDADNIAKAVCDAANGVLWIDDAQVAELRVLRIIGTAAEAPRVEVLVQALEPLDITRTTFP